MGSLPDRAKWSRAGSSPDYIRPAHGVHAVRHHRCRRPAELARATGGVERRWCRAMAMSAERHGNIAVVIGATAAGKGTKPG